MKATIKLFFIVLISSQAFSQGVTDAVRWSFTNPGGTARTLGVGGAFGAMGGDYSVISINPAGLGAYRKSEFTFSPSLTNNKTTSFIVSDQNAIKNNKYNTFSIDNMSLVFTKSKENRTSSFAFGFSKVSDLNKNFAFSGKSNGSITERFAERANGKIVDDLDDFEAYPAYNVGAIYDLNEDKNYETDFTRFDVVSKNQKVDQSGYINELSLGWGSNYKEKILFGISVGVPFVSFEEIKQYQESDADAEIPIFNELNYTEYLNTSGIGANIKAGFIYAPVKAIRLGGAFHTPTWMTLSDDYYTNLDYSYNDGSNKFYEKRSPDGSFKYTLTTPAKLIGSLGTIYDFGVIKGFVNGDVEWIDYNNNKFDFTSFSSDPSEKQNTINVNNEVQKFLGSVVNLRLGTEMAIGKIRLRAGIERGDSPLSNDTDKIVTNSFGVGIREDNFFLDFGMRVRKFTEGYVPYVLVDTDDETLVNNNISHTRLVLTAGFKF